MLYEQVGKPDAYRKLSACFVIGVRHAGEKQEECGPWYGNQWTLVDERPH